MGKILFGLALFIIGAGWIAGTIVALVHTRPLPDSTLIIMSFAVGLMLVVIGVANFIIEGAKSIVASRRRKLEAR